jgi:thiamine pyrophosphate-dependent acetolactate synthase large subunit-like protein
MKRVEVLEAVAQRKSTGISVATMRVVPGWANNGGAETQHFNVVGCMGVASSIGLGLALAQPEKKVIVLDGDGSLLMQLGSLATVAGTRARNFYHLVFVNRIYETSGHQSIPSSENIDFAGLAKAAGYNVVAYIDDVGVLHERLPDLLQEDGPVLLAFEVEPEFDREPFPRGIPPNQQVAHLREELVGDGRTD